MSGSTFRHYPEEPNHVTGIRAGPDIDAELLAEGISGLHGAIGLGTPIQFLCFQVMKNGLSPTKVRQAIRVPPMRFVLNLSIAGAIMGLLIAWLIFNG
jgi:hypothetical protein